MAKRRKKRKVNSNIFNSKTKKAVGFVLFLVVLFGATIVITNFASNQEAGITGQAYKVAKYGIEIDYKGMSSNYPLNLGANTYQTAVKIPGDTLNKIYAGDITIMTADIVTDLADIAGNVAQLLTIGVPNPVSVATELSDRFVDVFAKSNKCLKQVASQYRTHGEAYIVIGSTAEKEYSSYWKGNYIYAKHTYYDGDWGNEFCSERKCVGFVYDNGETTTSCW